MIARTAFRVALALALTASPAAAQFTAVVAPPKARPAEATVATTTPGATRDTAGRTALTDMRAWVDSAAGVTAPATPAPATPAPADSAVIDTTIVSPSPAAPQVQVPEVQEGATRAPDTSTMLPSIAVLGLAMLGAGTWLLRRARA